MKRTIAALLSCVMVVSLVGCKDTGVDSTVVEQMVEDAVSTKTSTQNHDTTTLYINLSSEPEFLDPTLNTTLDGISLAVNSFTGLYAYNQDEEIVPAIASGEPNVSEDGCVYTISLKKTKWSNGDDLTADDFIYSWNRAIDPATGAAYANMFDTIARKEDGTLAVTALDDYTLEIHLNSPCAYFMELLAFPVYYPVPRASVEAANPTGTTPGAWAWEAGFVCNGAFCLKEWEHDNYMLYEKNPNFYDAANVKLDKLNFMLNADDSVCYMAYNSGDLDFADQIPTAEIEPLMEDGEFHVKERLGTFFLVFNVEAPFFDGMTVDQAKKFRQAISLLIDRKYIIETIAQADQVAADSFIPEGMSDGKDGVYKTSEVSYYDSKKTGVAMESTAMELLEECGYSFAEQSDGTYSCTPALTIPFITNYGDLNRKIAESIQSDLAQVGIDMSIEEMDKNAFYHNQETGDFVFSRSNWTADYDDPSNMLEAFASSSGNNVALLGRGDSMEEYQWAQYDDLLSQIRNTQDQEERLSLMHQAEDMLMDTQAVLPLYYDNDVYLQKSNVSGVYVTTTGIKYFLYASKQ